MCDINLPYPCEMCNKDLIDGRPLQLFPYYRYCHRHHWLKIHDVTNIQLKNWSLYNGYSGCKCKVCSKTQSSACVCQDCASGMQKYSRARRGIYTQLFSADSKWPREQYRKAAKLPRMQMNIDTFIENVEVLDGIDIGPPVSANLFLRCKN